jgi:hypothetical protein
MHKPTYNTKTGLAECGACGKKFPGGSAPARCLKCGKEAEWGAFPAAEYGGSDLTLEPLKFDS